MNQFLIIFLLAPSIAFAAVLPPAQEAAKSAKPAKPCEVAAEMIKFVDQYIKTSPLESPHPPLPFAKFSKILDTMFQETVVTIRRFHNKFALERILDNPSKTAHETLYNLVKEVYDNVRGQLIDRIDEVRLDFEIMGTYDLIEIIQEQRNRTDAEYPELKKETNKAWDSVQAFIRRAIFESIRDKLNEADKEINDRLDKALREFRQKMAMSEWVEAIAALEKGLNESEKTVKKEIDRIEHDFQNFDYAKIHNEIEKAIAGETICLTEHLY